MEMQDELKAASQLPYGKVAGAVLVTTGLKTLGRTMGSTGSWGGRRKEGQFDWREHKV